MSKNPEKRTWTEEIQVAANQAADRVRELVAEGNVRRIIVRKPDGEVLVDLPLTESVLAAGAFTLIAPGLALLGAGAAVLTRVSIEVVRESP